jgi:hypothetical protein
MKISFCPLDVENLLLVCLPYAQLGQNVILGKDLSFKTLT